MDKSSEVMTCFLCNQEIDEISLSVITDSERQENSFMLCQILELPHLKNNTNKWVLSEINYCHLCEGRISKIRNLLEELEALEKEVLHEKCLIELQLKESYMNFQNNQSNFKDINSRLQLNPSEEFRVKIMSEMRSTTIQSILEKIRNGRIGHRFSPYVQANKLKADLDNNIKKNQSVQNPEIVILQSEKVGLNSDPVVGPSSSHQINNTFTLANSSQNPQEKLTSRHPINSTHSTSIYKGRLRSLPSKRKYTGAGTVGRCNSSVQSTADNVFGHNSNSASTSVSCFYDENDINNSISGEGYVDLDPLEVTVVEQRFLPQNNSIAPVQLLRAKHLSNICAELPEITMKYADVESAAQSAEVSTDSEIKSFICGECDLGFVEFNKMEEHDCMKRSKWSDPVPFYEIDDDDDNRMNTKIEPPEFEPYQNITRPKHNRKSKRARLHNSWKAPRKCEECGKILSTTSTWRNHVMTVHRAQSKFHCTLCNYGCQLSATLKIHMNRHSTDRNFSCHLCIKTYKNKRSLNKHLQSIHSNNCYPCIQCSAIFLFETKLRNHKTKVHGIDLEIV